MDNLTHTLTGVALARLGIGGRAHGAALTLALASNLPDLDSVSGLFGPVSYLEHHRAISHAFFASPLFAAGLAFVLSRWPGSRREFGPTFLLAWLGVVLHIVWDLWTSYGTRALLPFDATWYSWDWMFIVDPLFLALLAGASFWGSAKGRGRAMVLACGYIFLRAGAHEMARGQAESLAGSDFTQVRALPDPLRLNRWRLLASSEEAFATGYVPAIGTARSKVTIPRVPQDALARRVASESRAARVFLDFSAFPRFDTRREGDLTVMVWRDLRFADRRADGFFCEVKVDAAGRVVSDRVVFLRGKFEKRRYHRPRAENFRGSHRAERGGPHRSRSAERRVLRRDRRGGRRINRLDGRTGEGPRRPPRGAPFRRFRRPEEFCIGSSAP